MRPVAAVSVDLDPISCYYRIHALGDAPAAARSAIARRCVPRFAELLAERGIAATFFAVGSDLDDAAGREAVAALAAAGHEIGNHTQRHHYDLARRPRDEVAEEIARAHDRIGEVAGRAPVGFRAPGYDVSAAMFDELMRLGYRYDSSVFPAPAYYAAKAAVMGAMRLLGRRSGAVLTDPRALAAPPDPYRPDPRAPWRRGQAPLVELPIAVTPFGRVPAIGTSLLVAPRWLRARWLRAMRRRPFFNFELHGIDLADAVGDGLPDALVARQPDLRVPGEAKRRALEEILDWLAGEGGYELAPLRVVADRVQREGGLG